MGEPVPIFTGKARPHYFLPGTVWEAALERVRWLYDEFDNHVSVSTSGGKDSTVVLELAAIVAAERGLPGIKAHFLDQEAEYQATIDYMRYVRDRPDVDLDWYQIPFRLFNTTSHTTQWTNVWDTALSPDEWIRPKEPDSIHVNPFVDRKGAMVDRFKAVLTEMNKADGGAILTGMRCEESPTRRIFMTSVPSYKWATWCSGGKSAPFHLFHPIYDWSYRDVWKSIHDNGWRYNTFYDSMFQFGVTLRAMRVSSFHHEQSYLALNYLQEIEPATWERATRRVPGLNTYKSVGDSLTGYYLHHLPHMFASWAEYLEYLIEHLIEGEDNRERFRKMWHGAEHTLPFVPRREIVKTVLNMVMINDVFGSNFAEWIVTQKSQQVAWERYKREHRADGVWDERDEVGRSA